MNTCSCDYEEMYHVLNRRGVSPEILQLLFDRGVLSDVVEASILGTLPSRDDLRTFLHLKSLAVIEPMLLQIEYDHSFGEMVAAGQYAWKDPHITEKRFSVKGKGNVTLEAKLFHFDRRISSEETKNLIIRDDSVHPWRPASVEHTLVFGATYPEMQRQRFPIVALNATCLVNNTRFALCLGSMSTGRILFLERLSGQWFVYVRFLAVREPYSSL